jgi:hypothetical protein
MEARAEVERLRKDTPTAGQEWARAEAYRQLLQLQSKRAEKAESEVERLRGKLQRVRDAIKFAANSDGGLVAEIDDALRGGE